MMKRSKSIQRRQNNEIDEKQGLLKNIEAAEPLKFHLLKADKARLLTAEELALGFGPRCLFDDLSFKLDVGERIAITGPNGSGKSSLLKLVLGQLRPTHGVLRRPASLVISTLPQETDFLNGTLRAFATAQGIDESLLLTLLRKLDFEREAFERPMERYSAGQKKKVCLAASLAKPAPLFVWDEPLNYIDVLSREQIEAAVLESGPSMLFVEHDATFVQRVATGSLAL